MKNIKIDLNNILVTIYSNSDRVLDYISRYLFKIIVHTDEESFQFQKKIEVYLINNKFKIEHEFPDKIKIHGKNYTGFNDNVISILSNGDSFFNFNIENKYIFFDQFSNINYHILDIIIKSFISTIIKDKEYCILHASAIKYKNRNILFCGPGESGKTSMLLSMLQDKDCFFLSNNLVAVDSELNCFGFPLQVSVKEGTCNEITNLKNIFSSYNHNKEKLLDIANFYNKKKVVWNKPFKLDEIYLLNWNLEKLDETKVNDFNLDFNFTKKYFKINNYIYYGYNIEQQSNFFKKYLKNNAKIVTGKFDISRLSNDIRSIN